MQFVLLIYQGATPLPNTPEWSSLDEEEQQAIYADYGAVNAMAGITPGLPLGLPSTATTVRVEDGRTLATDGPYVDARRAVGGYFVVEADSLEAAVGIAARIPAARHGGGVEVRAVASYW